MGDNHVVDIQVVVAFGNPAAAEVEIQPDRLNPECINIAHTDICLFKGRLPIDPASQNTIFFARRFEKAGACNSSELKKNTL